jgi:PPP family 3-phenylpropionic acid transporter
MGQRGALYYFSYFAAAGTFMPFLAVFYAHRGLSGSEIGVLLGIGPLVALLVTPAVAALADRRSRRVRTLSLALAGTALCLLALPLPGSFATLLPVVVVLALVSGPVNPLGDSVIAAMAAHNRLAFGKLRFWGSLSWALVATLGGALYQEAGFSLMFPLAALFFLATSLIAGLLPEERPSEAQAQRPLRMVLRDRRLSVLMIATFALGLSTSMAMTFAGVYLDRLSGQFLVGLFAGAAAAAELPMMHWSEGIMRRLGGPGALVLAYALFGSAYLGVALLTAPLLLLGMALIRGFGLGLFTPTNVRIVAGWAPPGLSATYQGLMSASLWGLAPLVAAPLGGVIYDALGPTALFLTCVAAAALAALIVVLAHLGGVFKRPDEYSEEAQPVVTTVGTD